MILCICVLSDVTSLLSLLILLTGILFFSWLVQMKICHIISLVSISPSSTLVFVILFLLLNLGLVFFSFFFSPSLWRCKVLLFEVFFKNEIISIIFTFTIAFAAFHTNGMFFFYFSYFKYIFISTLISLMTFCLLRSMLLISIAINFPVFLL